MLNIFDFMSGIGSFSYGFKKFDGCSITGIEQDPDMVRLSRQALGLGSIYNMTINRDDSFSIVSSNKNQALLLLKKSKNNLESIEIKRGYDILLSSLTRFYDINDGRHISPYNYHRTKSVFINKLIKYLELVNLIRPKIFILEVPITTKGLVSSFINYTKKINEKYIYQSILINYKDFGIPIYRKRYLFIGLKKTIQEILDITPTDILPKKQPPRTVFDAIFDLREIPIGSIYDHIEIADRSKLERKLLRYRKKYSRYILKWHDVAYIEYGIFKRPLIHPDYNRFITLKEIERLMTFPDTFNFRSINKKGLIKKLWIIINAIPLDFSLLLAERIATFLRLI